MKRTFLLVGFLLSWNSWGQTYVVSPKQSLVTWLGTKTAGKHSGTIGLRSGKVIFEKEVLKSGTLQIDMQTIQTTDLEGKSKKNLDNHLNSADFFDVNQHKTASFVFQKSESVPERGPKGFPQFRISGNLTIKGITRPAGLLVEVQKGDKDQVTASGKMTFDRTDYGIQYKSGRFFPKLKDKIIHDDVSLSFKVVALKASSSQ